MTWNKRLISLDLSWWQNVWWKWFSIFRPIFWSKLRKLFSKFFSLFSYFTSRNQSAWPQKKRGAERWSAQSYTKSQTMPKEVSHRVISMRYRWNRKGVAMKCPITGQSAPVVEKVAHEVSSIIILLRKSHIIRVDDDRFLTPETRFKSWTSTLTKLEISPLSKNIRNYKTWELMLSSSRSEQIRSCLWSPSFTTMVVTKRKRWIFIIRTSSTPENLDKILSMSESCK